MSLLVTQSYHYIGFITCLWVEVSKSEFDLFIPSINHDFILFFTDYVNKIANKFFFTDFLIFF